MKRTYVNRLPKGENGTVKNARIENGQLIVEVEFEEKFEPKDGDFCVSNNGYVFILKSVYISSHFEKCASCYYGIDANGYLDYNLNYTIDDGRFATPEEKADFLERLEKEYKKRWNAKTKKLEDIRWRADKKGLYYYLVAGENPVVHGCIDIGISCDNVRYEKGNYFRTREAAQKVADQIKEIFKNSKAE